MAEATAMAEAICWSEIESWSEVKPELLRIAAAEPWNTKLRDEIAADVGDRFEGGSDAVVGIWNEAAARAKIEADRLKIAAAPKAEPPMKRRKLPPDPSATPRSEVKARLRVGPPGIEAALRVLKGGPRLCGNVSGGNRSAIREFAAKC